MTDTTFDLNRHMFSLLQKEPFFAAISRRLNKRADNTVKTAGVRVDPESLQFEMLYNPEFFNRLVESHQQYVDALPAPTRRDYIQKHSLSGGKLDPYVWVRGVIMHELFHVVFGHVTFRLPSEGMSDKWNVATDLAINSNIADQLPPQALVPGRNGYEGLPMGQSAEWYMENLPEDKQGSSGSSGSGEGSEEGGEGSGGGEGSEGSEGGSSPSQETLDDHSGWQDVPQEARDLMDERARQITQQAVSEANARGWGSVSGATKRGIIDAITPKVNWQAILRAFVKRSQRSSRSSTVRRLDRRQPYVWAGKRVRRQARIAISIDQSGSVDDKMLSTFFSELSGLAKLAEFTVVPFDTRVDEDKVFVWKKGKNVKAERVLNGGTDFNAPTEYVNEQGFDGHIILTDLEAPKPIPSKCQRMWMTTPEHARRPYFTTNEKVIAVE